MSDHPDDEWGHYFLSKGVFANALRFAHLESPEDADRTPLLALYTSRPRNCVRMVCLLHILSCDSQVVIGHHAV